MGAPPSVAVAIALGAFLLFEVQFLLARVVLPWFGGAPAVWSTSLVAFQVLLLAGYAWAHGLARLDRRTQVRRHALLLGTAVLLLAWHALSWPSPLTPPDTWKPQPGAPPVTGILLLLVAAVGVPFTGLAATSPLLQRWAADSSPGREPYRLYALSNAGSLAGLLAYPLVVEPWLDLPQQAWAWTTLFVAYAAAMTVAAWHMRAVPVLATPDVAASAPTGREQAVWVVLAAVPSALLQATTTRLTIDIAAVPFLWMLPLALYLITFIVAFEGHRAWPHTWLAVAAAVAALVAQPDWGASLSIATTLLAFGTIAMAMHAALARRAPAPVWLTRFFLLVSTGGALGSALVAFGAPVAFAGVHEFPLGLMVALVVLGTLEAGTASHAGRARLAERVVAASLVLLGGMIAVHAAREWRFTTRRAVVASRNFFGAIRVRDLESPAGAPYRAFEHGTTLHGLQFHDGAAAREPAAYYTTGSGVGRAMQALRARGRPLRIGVVGLGAGTFAAFGRAGDAITFYEIDPDIIALSTGAHPAFTYVRDSAAQVTMIAGDGRLGLERASPLALDLLVLDAFSSDGVPVHLLTHEAMQVYVRHLRDDSSLLAFNVTNRYLDLREVVGAGGAAVGLRATFVNHLGQGDLAKRTRWMILGRDTATLEAIGPVWVAPAGARPWTDAWSNLVRAVRRD